MFYRALPEKWLQYKNFKNDSVKVFKERLTILFACYMPGDEILKPLVICRSENPRCFKNFNKANSDVLTDIIVKKYTFW